MCGSYEIYKSRRWGDCTFARSSPVLLSRKPLSLDIESIPKTDLSVSGSLVHRQTWRLTGQYNISLRIAQTQTNGRLFISRSLVNRQIRRFTGILCCTLFTHIGSLAIGLAFCMSTFSIILLYLLPFYYCTLLTVYLVPSMTTTQE